MKLKFLFGDFFKGLEKEFPGFFSQSHNIFNSFIDCSANPDCILENPLNLQ